MTTDGPIRVLRSAAGAPPVQTSALNSPFNLAGTFRPAAIDTTDEETEMPRTAADDRPRRKYTKRAQLAAGPAADAQSPSTPAAAAAQLLPFSPDKPAPTFLVMVANDGSFRLEKDRELIELTPKETAAMLAYLDRMHGDDTTTD